MKITYNVAGLVIEVKDGGASLKGTLKDACPDCDQTDCYDGCENDFTSPMTTKDIDSRIAYNNVMDGIESLLLALATQGVNIALKEFKTAIQTAQDAAANEHF